MSLQEDVGNSVGNGSVAANPTKLAAPIARRSWEQFDVPQTTFKKFETGRNKFERWSKFLDQSDEKQKAVYDYAAKNPKATIVLRCNETGALRGIRRRSSCGA